MSAAGSASNEVHYVVTEQLTDCTHTGTGMTAMVGAEQVTSRLTRNSVGENLSLNHVLIYLVNKHNLFGIIKLMRNGL